MLASCRTSVAAREFPQTPSHAIGQDEKTRLGENLREDIAANPGKSGFRLLTQGSLSFAARLGLIQAAEKTIDLQYYSMHDDMTSNLLLEAVVRAAQRGVRVRLLLDGIHTGDVEGTLAVLSEFKNIEIRIFNPFATRDDGLGGRVLKALTDIESVNYRMHNKALIADNQMAIIGGRNLGDEYFEENTNLTFRDIDILTAGPVTAGISRSFDDYWNDRQAQPIGRLQRPDHDPVKRQRLRAAMTAEWQKAEQSPDGALMLGKRFSERLRDDDVRLTWAAADVVVDAPEKTQRDAEENSSMPLRRLEALLRAAKSEFIAVSPYFVPQEEGVNYLRDLVARGIRVRVVTNSLASTDVVAVHTGYRRYREDVVAAGVELYEMKPIGGDRPRQRLLGTSAPASASLHAKAYVVDRKEVMIGSFNLDPRSAELNTEIALAIHSPELAAELVKMFEEVTDAESSYRVEAQDGGLVWRGVDETGKAVEKKREPDAGFWRSIQMNLMSVLPIEDSL
jgi:putative cardiolipin synthase